MKENRQDYLGEPVTQKLLSPTPVYFNDAQRQATKDAGQSLVLEVNDHQRSPQPRWCQRSGQRQRQPYYRGL
ncbi:Hsp70 family protein [Escherichia coli]